MLLKDYPSPVLNYKQARQRRVKQLEKQRQLFLHQQNVVPYLARLPEFLTPFGAERFASEVGWAKARNPQLFPPALDLDDLDLEQSYALRTWFVAHVNITPRKPRQAKKKLPKSADFTQLNLLEL